MLEKEKDNSDHKNDLIENPIVSGNIIRFLDAFLVRFHWTNMWSPQQNMMWPGQQQPPPVSQQPRVPPPYGSVNYGGQQPLTSANGVGQHTQQPPLLPDPTWPNDFMLEQQFSQMSFNQPPPPMYQQHQTPRPISSRAGQPTSM